MKRFAFIDESGADSHSPQALLTEPFFVIAAVTVDEVDLDECRRIFTDVKNQFFPQAQEMSSVTIRKNDQRRQQIIQALCKASFRVYVLVVDRTTIKSTGLTFPPSFVKAFHNHLYQRVSRDTLTLEIISDEIKGSSFTAEVQRYMDKRYQQTLFESRSFRTEKSISEPCIQAADIIAGSILKWIRTPVGERNTKYLEFLLPKITDWLTFPPTTEDAVVQNWERVSSMDDARIQYCALILAQEFTNLHADEEDPRQQMRVTSLHLLLARHYSNPYTWVPTIELCKRCHEVVGDPITPRAFRGTIIGPLRDKDVLIASKRTGGYKLPTGLADLTEFINTQNEKVGPMLDRVRRARSAVLGATNARVDILGAPEFGNLRAALHGLEISLPFNRLESGLDARGEL